MATPRVMLLLFTLLGMYQDALTEITMTTDGSWASTSSYDYGIDIRGTDHIYFWVKCCNDAFLHMFPTYANPADSVTVGFGVIGNAKCNMKPCSACGEWYSADFAFLSCQDFRPFWIHWTGNDIKLGQGHLVGQHIMISVQGQMTFTPQYMSVSSGWSAIGVWKIYGNYQINPSPCTPMNFRLYDVNSKVSQTAIHTSTLMTNVDCVMECRLIRGCKSVNYRASDLTCDIFNTVPLPGELMTDSKWELWISG